MGGRVDLSGLESAHIQGADISILTLIESGRGGLRHDNLIKVYPFKQEVGFKNR